MGLSEIKCGSICTVKNSHPAYQFTAPIITFRRRKIESNLLFACSISLKRSFRSWLVTKSVIKVTNKTRKRSRWNIFFLYFLENCPRIFHIFTAPPRMLEFQIPHHLISLFSTNRTGALSRIFSTDLSPKKTPVISGHNSYQYPRKFSPFEELYQAKDIWSES